MRMLPLASLLLLLSIPAIAAGEATAADGKSTEPVLDAEAWKREDIRRLLELTGTREMAKQTLSQFVSVLKANTPELPEAFWPAFLEEARTDELVEIVIPIYEKYLSHEEVLQLIAFYETPLGQKLLVVLPVISQASMEAGQAWGKQAAQRAIEKILGD